jgi:hypothetical protein
MDCLIAAAGRHQLAVDLDVEPLADVSALELTRRQA